MKSPADARPLRVAAGCAAAAVVSGALIWALLPHERDVTSAGVLLLKLVPFALAVEAIAAAPTELLKAKWLQLTTMVGFFLVYFLYFVPHIFYFGVRENDAPDQMAGLYYTVLTLSPLIILSLVLSYRLGGGGSATVRRVAYGSLLLMLSGLEDLAFLLSIAHTIPDQWTWASHIAVFLGHTPSKWEAFAFIAVHVALAAFVFLSPARWWQRAVPWTSPSASPSGLVAER